MALPRSLRTLAQRLTVLAFAGWSASACSFHSSASFQTGTSTPEGQVREKRAAQHDDDQVRHRRRVRVRADKDIARIDRETQERVANAEREAAEQERAADEEAAAARQRAAEAAEAERQREASQPSAAITPAKRRIELSRTVKDNSTDPAKVHLEELPADQRATRINSEIDQNTVEKKIEIRKRLSQNKADILIAAERKRNEVREALKKEASEKP
jgi:colicin import membrane protein